MFYSVDHAPIARFILPANANVIRIYKFKTNNWQQLNCVKPLWNIGCENSHVTPKFASHSQEELSGLYSLSNTSLTPWYYGFVWLKEEEAARRAEEEKIKQEQLNQEQSQNNAVDEKGGRFFSFKDYKIYSTPLREHITQSPKNLIKEQIHFKIALLVFKWLNETTPWFPHFTPPAFLQSTLDITGLNVPLKNKVLRPKSFNAADMEQSSYCHKGICYSICISLSSKVMCDVTIQITTVILTICLMMNVIAVWNRAFGCVVYNRSTIQPFHRETWL